MWYKLICTKLWKSRIVLAIMIQWGIIRITDLNWIPYAVIDKFEKHKIYLRATLKKGSLMIIQIPILASRHICVQDPPDPINKNQHQTPSQKQHGILLLSSQALYRLPMLPHTMWSSQSASIGLHLLLMLLLLRSMRTCTPWAEAILLPNALEHLHTEALVRRRGVARWVTVYRALARAVAAGVNKLLIFTHVGVCIWHLQPVRNYILHGDMRFRMKETKTRAVRTLEWPFLLSMVNWYGWVL